MYSKLRRKLNFTIACVIIPMVFLSIIAQSTIAQSINTNWEIGNSKNNVYPARPGSTPILDGIEEASWQTLLCPGMVDNVDGPNVEFRMKYNSSFIYCLVIVKKNDIHTNEAVLLILSNNGTTAPQFPDAKYINFDNNFTEDRRLVANNYTRFPSDNQNNITGKAGLSFEAGIRNWSVYEFRFNYNNTDTAVDANWTFGKTYAAKLRVGDATTIGNNTATGTYTEYPSFGIEFGVLGGPGNETITPFDLDVKLLTWIAFIVVGGIYAIIGLYVAISKNKVSVFPKERAPEELEDEAETPSENSGEEHEEAEDLEEE